MQYLAFLLAIPSFAIYFFLSRFFFSSSCSSSSFSASSARASAWVCGACRDVHRLEARNRRTHSLSTCDSRIHTPHQVRHSDGIAFGMHKLNVCTCIIIIVIIYTVMGCGSQLQLPTSLFISTVSFVCLFSSTLCCSFIAHDCCCQQPLNSVCFHIDRDGTPFPSTKTRSTSVNHYANARDLGEGRRVS